MSKKSEFIKLVKTLMEETNFSNEAEKWNDAVEYWETFKEEGTENKMTENGAKILKWMQDSADDCNNLFKAKTIAEGLFINSKSVSGSMRKLISNGYVEKMGGSPVIYAITPAGMEYQFDN